jgi:hypothetical protein
MWRVIAASVIFATACGPAKPPPGDPVVGNVKPDAGTTVAALAAGCPAAWGAGGQGCDPVASPNSCGYAEGNCYCGVPYPCTGVDLGDDWAAGIPPTWQCTENPPDVRADGCPGLAPSGACWSEGQECSYGDCCFQVLTCQNGAWEVTGGGCPP